MSNELKKRFLNHSLLITHYSSLWKGGILSVALSRSFFSPEAESDGGRYPPPCPVEPGLSSPGKNEGMNPILFRQRPSGRPVDHYNYTLPAGFLFTGKAC